MNDILTSIIKEITSDVTIDSIPAITPQDKVTAEFVNAVNQGFKLGINGNFKLIKSHNGLHIDTLSGKEFSGKSRFVGVFENVNLGETIPVFEVNFGLVKFVDFNNENFWKDFLQDTLLFVKVNNSNNGSILHLNCKFLTQSQTTDGDGDTSITYTDSQKTVQLRLIKSDEEPYTVNNLIDKITPIKLSFDEIDSGIIKFNAQTTDDITVADLTNLWGEINTLNTTITALENEVANKVDILEATQLSAYVRYPYDEQGASLMPVDVSPTPVSLVLRGGSGHFEVNAPTYTHHPANKLYVDENIAINLITAKGYTDTKIADLVGSAPELLDTLEEIAEAINNNEEFGSYVVNKFTEVNTSLDTKIDKDDRYLEWETVVPVSNTATLDFNITDKFQINTSANITINILNDKEGICGLVKVSGGGSISSFNAPHIYNADSGYLNAESGQSYLYSFVGGPFGYIINRTVING